MAVSNRAAVDLREPGGWRRTKNQIAIGVMWFAFVVLPDPARLRSWHGDRQGRHGDQLAVPHQRHDPAERAARQQRRHGRRRSSARCEITAFAAVIAIPLGILGAVYINEYGGNRSLAKLISFMADVMTGVPSIVMGLFIFTIWVIPLGLTGLSGMAGSFALACLMLPIVIRSSYEMLRLVPDSLRQGSYALGATKARVTLTVVLPSAIGGIVSGALLAVARAAGETAPLLFTIVTVEATNPNLFSGANTALSTQIFVNATQPYNGAVDRAWGSALTLIAITFILMIVARLVTARFNRYSR